MNEKIRALNRFGLGARVGQTAEVGEPRGWLKDQLAGPAPAMAPDAEIPSREAPAEALRALLRARRQEDASAREEARRAIRDVVRAEARALLRTRIWSDRPFPERLVAFWSNHFCVSVAGKGILAPLAGAYEREAIRPHVLGRFEEMALASAHHPAMLLYLDNAQSTGPGSPVARRRGRREGGAGGRGLNENYARELLELHTLGVHGGYDQADVEALARVLTGWTVAGLGDPRAPDASAGPVRFVFREAMHEPGPKTVLRTTYREAGAGEGEAVIRTLAHHPATAGFVATKLVRHFVSDDPPAGAVKRISAVFLESGGDLSRVAGALVDLDEAWDPDNRKFRAPQDWLVAALRAFHAREAPEPAYPALEQLRHPLWSPPSPKGFGDTAREWADPDALMNRAELARSIGRAMPLARVEPLALLDVAEVGPGDPLGTLLADETIPTRERVALAMAGPAFQWR